MTKEQEIIEKLKESKKIDFNTLVRTFKKEGIENFAVIRDEYLETALNMLKEKDEEIEKYKKRNKELSNQILILYKEQDNYNARIDKKNTELKKKNEELDMYKDIKEIANSKATELVKLKQYDDLKKKVDRQDKMIDLMAEALVKVPNNEDNLIIEVINRNLEQNKEEAKQYFEKQANKEVDKNE